MKLFVVDRKTTQPTNASSAPSSRTLSGTTTIKTPNGKITTLPRVKLIVYPPHPDWFKYKPVPRAPLPLYHPYRVTKPPKPIYVSKALPLTRKIVDEQPSLPRSSARNRKPAYKAREGDVDVDALLSPTSSGADEGVKKVRRARRKKAEMIAAAIEANLVGENAIATRGKRKRADETVADANAADGTPARKRRRRRVGGVLVSASGDEAAQLTLQPTVQSSYGTRSRTKNNKKDGAEVEAEADSATASVTASDNDETMEGGEETPKPKRAGRRKDSPPAVVDVETMQVDHTFAPVLEVPANDATEKSGTTEEQQDQEPKTDC